MIVTVPSNLRDSIRHYVPGQDLHDVACMVTPREKERRAFSPEFKAVAVRMVAARRVDGITLFEGDFITALCGRRPWR